MTAYWTDKQSSYKMNGKVGVFHLPFFSRFVLSLVHLYYIILGMKVVT